MNDFDPATLLKAAEAGVAAAVPSLDCCAPSPHSTLASLAALEQTHPIGLTTAAFQETPFDANALIAAAVSGAALLDSPLGKVPGMAPSCCQEPLPAQKSESPIHRHPQDPVVRSEEPRNARLSETGVHTIPSQDTVRVGPSSTGDTIQHRSLGEAPIENRRIVSEPEPLTTYRDDSIVRVTSHQLGLESVEPTVTQRSAPIESSPLQAQFDRTNPPERNVTGPSSQAPEVLVRAPETERAIHTRHPSVPAAELSAAPIFAPGGHAESRAASTMNATIVPSSSIPRDEVRALRAFPSSITSAPTAQPSEPQRSSLSLPSTLKDSVSSPSVRTSEGRAAPGIVARISNYFRPTESPLSKVAPPPSVASAPRGAASRVQVPASVVTTHRDSAQRQNTTAVIRRTLRPVLERVFARVGSTISPRPSATNRGSALLPQSPRILTFRAQVARMLNTMRARISPGHLVRTVRESLNRVLRSLLRREIRARHRVSPVRSALRPTPRARLSRPITSSPRDSLKRSTPRSRGNSQLTREQVSEKVRLLTKQWRLAVRLLALTRRDRTHPLPARFRREAISLRALRRGPTTRHFVLQVIRQLEDGLASLYAQRDMLERSEESGLLEHPRERVRRSAKRILMRSRIREVTRRSTDVDVDRREVMAKAMESTLALGVKGATGGALMASTARARVTGTVPREARQGPSQTLDVTQSDEGDDKRGAENEK